MNPIELSLFSSRINAVCEEMGARLRAAAFSPNIRDRLDFSCAIFDQHGRMCAQAAHIPVHLGSMAYAMGQVTQKIHWAPGNLVLFNDPFLGGTHLPDLTLVTPLFVESRLMGFVVNRAHHADIGASQPGSMPISTSIKEEGLLISPTIVGTDGKIDRRSFDSLFDGVQNSAMSFADLSAQASANLCGVQRMSELIDIAGIRVYQTWVEDLHDYGERLMRAQLQNIPDGKYSCEDVMDDDGQGRSRLVIAVQIEIKQGTVSVDFNGTCEQVAGNINCPMSVTAAAVYYVFRCLFTTSVPLCAGTFRPIEIRVPQGCMLNAVYPAAVVAGNVETSSRIVDVLFGALAAALPLKIPACSQGTMNNLALGQSGQSAWSYYETIAGGVGATATQSGADAVQTHMTNTQNTPIEILEMHFPLRIKRYALRDGSGGIGMHRGSCGLIREYEFLASPTRFTILSERRTQAPRGLSGGGDGKPGHNALNGISLPGKFSGFAHRGDVLTIETPGGGAFGTLSGTHH